MGIYLEGVKMVGTWKKNFTPPTKNWVSIKVDRSTDDFSFGDKDFTFEWTFRPIGTDRWNFIKNRFCNIK